MELKEFGARNFVSINESQEYRVMREAAKTFEDLLVWQKAHAYVLEIYRMTKVFPKEELYGLTSQLRRASVSIPANIAEGFKKRTSKDKAHALTIAQGSLEECRYYLRLCMDLGYADPAACNGLLVETSKLLEKYRNAIIKDNP
jgi:four helix bundle protein